MIRDNLGLLTTLAERWHSETSTFYFPTGEMSVTLEDVYHILRLPINGEIVQNDQRIRLEECKYVFGVEDRDDYEIG